MAIFYEKYEEKKKYGKQKKKERKCEIA